MSYSIARQRALAAEKRRTFCETELRPRRCDRCKQSKPREQSRDIPKPGGLKAERVCFGCLPEGGDA